MPQVPYNPIPQQGPADIPTPYRTATDATPAAFGAGVGEAKERLGAQVEKTGDMLSQRVLAIQDLQNKAENDKLDTEYMEKAGSEHQKFSAMQGGDRAAYFPTYIKNLKTMREEVRSKASNPMVQKQFDSSSLGVLGRTIFNGAGAAGSGAAEDAIRSNQALQDATRNFTATQRDPAAIEAGAAKMRRLAAEGARTKGITDPEAVKGVSDTAGSSVYRDTFVDASKEDPFKAKEAFEEYVKKNPTKMTAEDQKYVRDHLLNAETSVGATGIANDVMKENTDDHGDTKMTLKQAEKRVEEKADQLAPNNPMLKEHAKKQLYTLYHQKKFSDTQDKNENMNTVANLIMTKGYNTVQEVMADPEGAKAMEGLHGVPLAAAQLKITGWIAGRDKEHNAAMMTQLAGMAKNDKESFLAFDPTEEKYNLSQTNQKSILNEQRQMLKTRTALDNPRVQQAMQYLRNAVGKEMQTMNIYKRTGNEEGYDSFTGSLTQALQAWEDTHGGKRPSGTDLEKEIWPSLIKTVPYKTWYGGTGQEIGVQKAPTETYSKAYKSKYPDASDEEVQRQYQRDILREVYKSKVSAGTTPK